MGIKVLLKQVPLINNMNVRIKAKDFYKEKKFFISNYMYSKPVTKEKLEYSMLFEVHGLEKGFTVKDGKRPFGVNKVRKIIKDLNTYDSHGYKPGFSYTLANSALCEYKELYNQEGWESRDEYKTVDEYLKNHKLNNHLPVGAFNYEWKDFINDAKIDYDRFISSRKSVRNYSAKKLSNEDIKRAVNMAIKSPTACNRQMCKIYYIKSLDGKKAIEKYAQGLNLFDVSNVSYFIITFDVSANYFIGEKSQGWFNSGLVTMNFINALHSLGIGSCCIQFGNSFDEEKTIKGLLNIPEPERISVIVAAGYYDDISRVPYSTRKPFEDVYRER